MKIGEVERHGVLTKEEYAKLKAQFKARYEGAHNAGRPPPITERLDILHDAEPYQRPHGKPGYDGEAPELVEPTRAAKWDKNAMFNNRTSTIAYLKARSTIDQEQFDAADRLQNDWQLGKIDPVASTVLVGAGGGGNLPNDAKADALKRHGRALDAIERQSPVARQVIELIVEKNPTTEKAAATLHMNQQFLIGVLVVGLDILVSHYGLRHYPRTSGFTLA